MRQSQFLKPSGRADSTVAQPLTVRIDKRVNLTSQDGNERSYCEISRQSWRWVEMLLMSSESETHLLSQSPACQTKKSSKGV